MNNRLIAISGAVAVVLVAVVLVKTVKAWNAPIETPQAAAVETKEDSRKTAAADKHKAGWRDDNWTPIPSGGMKGKRGGTADESVSETPGGLSGADETQTGLSSPADEGGKGSDGKGRPAGSKDPKAAGSAAANAAAKAAANAVSPEAAARSDALVKAAQELIDKGNFDQAHEKLLKSVQENPKNSSAWRQLTSVDKQLGNVDEMLDAYKQWTTELPGDKMARYDAAIAYASNGLSDESLQHLSAFQALGRGEPQSNAMASIVYRQLNMPVEQGNALNQYVYEEPTSLDAHRMLGEYYQQVGQPDQAFAEWQTMATLDPKSPAPYMQMGNAYVQMGQFDSALSQFETAVSVNPKNPEALSRMAYMQRQLGDLQGAVSTYQRVVNLDPNSTIGAQAAQHLQYIQGELSTQTQ